MMLPSTGPSVRSIPMVKRNSRLLCFHLVNNAVPGVVRPALFYNCGLLAPALFV